jgi:hypothetical protein
MKIGLWRLWDKDRNKRPARIAASGAPELPIIKSFDDTWMPSTQKRSTTPSVASSLHVNRQARGRDCCNVTMIGAAATSDNPHRRKRHP